MNISPTIFSKQSLPTSFKAKSSKKNEAVQQKTDTDQNPISRKGEAVNLVKATFLGGLALAAKLFWELIEDGDFEFDIYAKKASKLVEKNKKDASANKKFLYKIGAYVALLGASFAGFALLYTAYNTPKIMYDSKVNKFKKSKEMDVYIKSNQAEKEIYTQLADKAKATPKDDREDLKKQYVQMTIAKNQVPDFVKIKNRG